MTRILHFIPDDKFVDMIIDELNGFSDVSNRYCMYNRKSADEIRWHKHIDCVEFTPYGSEKLNEILKECREGLYDGVWFHSLPDHVDYFVANCGTIKKVFISWGQDIYGMMRYREYLPETKRFMRSFLFQGTTKGVAWRIFRDVQKWMSTSVLGYPLIRYVKTVANNMDYIAPVLSEDVELFRRAYPRLRVPETKEFQYGYYNIEPSVGTDRPIGPILVNNSATPSGNHVDVFRKLDVIGVKSVLIVPLNYGNPSTYLDFVKNKGEEILGNRFVPILDFMPKDEYFKYISQCTHMVMGHLRQQALANIAYGLSSGMKVFFWKDNPVYRQFTRWGFSLFALEDAKKEDFKRVLPVDEQRKNAELLMQHFGRDAMIGKLKRIIASMGR